MPKVLYVGCPRRAYQGDCASLLEQVLAAASWDPASWELDITYYEGNTSVDAKDFSSHLLKNPGPLLLLRPIQSTARIEIQSKVGDRIPVLIRDVPDLDALKQAIADVLAAYKAGEPQIPLDQAVALLFMHKLEDNHMWAGNAKSYMWNDDLRKGRGFDERHAHRLPHVLSMLEKASFLVNKNSQGKKKWALNPAIRGEIHETLRSRHFPNELRHALGSHDVQISVRVLDDCVAHAPPDR